MVFINHPPLSSACTAAAIKPLLSSKVGRLRTPAAGGAKVYQTIRTDRADVEFSLNS